MGSAAPDTSGTGLQLARVAEGAQILFSLQLKYKIKKKKNNSSPAHLLLYICSASYIDKCHDPESIVHIGLLYLSLVIWQVALSYVVLRNRTVSQHVPEMMHDLCPILCVIPTARL